MIRSLIILLALTVSVSAQRICPPNQVNRNGLVGRWLVPGKQTGAVATPTLCLDDSNKGNHGTTVASPNYGVIFSRAAMTFNGSSQYVSVPNNSALKPSLPITISAWVNGNGNNWNVNGNIVYLSDAIHPYYCGFDLVINFTGVVEVDYGSGGTPGASSRRTLISSLTVPTSGWHHIVATITSASNICLLYTSPSPRD